MPLKVGTTLPPPAGVPTPTRALTYTYAEWVAPDGSQWPLTYAQGARYFLTAGVAGLGSVPISIAVDTMPRGGSRARSQRAEARIVTLPLFLAGDEHADWVDLFGGLEDAFTQTEPGNPGILRIVRPGGVERRILALYDNGFEPSGGDDWRWSVVPISLYCEDGHFYDPTPIVLERAYTAGGTSFLDHFPRVSSGAVLGATTLTNPGQVKAYPTIRIDGPFSSFTATNNTTGETFEIIPGSALIAGEARIVTADPPTITDENGDSALGDLTMPGSVLWGLVRGDNAITFTAVGAGAGTLVTVSFNARYKRP